MARLLAIVLSLVLVFAGGCASAETGEDQDPLGRTSQAITGGTWENPDDPGNELLFRPNGTGQAYIASRNVIAEITWSMALENGRVLLSWSYVSASSGEAQEWIVEIEEDTMRVWPQKGSQLVLDPDSDEPVILRRTD